MADKPGDSSYDFAPKDEPAQKREPEIAKPLAPAEALPERNCPHCGFRIVGKTPRGRCPDCAAPLDLTATDLLQFSDTRWIRTMSNGTFLVGIAIGLHTAAIIVGWMQRWHAGAIIHMVAATLGMLGVLLATAKEPGIGAAPSATAPFARLAALVLLGLWIVLLIVTLKDLEQYWKVLIICVLITFAAESMLLGLHLHKLTIRIPSDSLASHLLNLSWIGAATCGLLVLLYLFNVANPAHLILFFCAFPMIGGFAAIGGWMIVTMLRVGLDFRSSARAGEDIAYRKAERARTKK